MQMLAQHATLLFNAHESARQNRAWFYVRRHACGPRACRHFLEDGLQFVFISNRERSEPLVYQLQ